MRSRVLPVVVWIGLAAGATGIGLATVSAVRAAVADDPVRVLSAADVAVLLQEPGADLDPIATLAAADTLPRGASGADEGQQVDSREAMAAEQADHSDVPTNADDRPSRLGSDPGTLGSTGGGPARVTPDPGGRGGLVADEVESRDNPPTPSQSPSPTPTVTPSPTPSQSTPSPSATESPDPSGSPSPEPSPSPSTSTSPVPSPTPPVATPSPTRSAPVTPTAGPPRPRPTATASPTAPPPMYTLVPLSGFVAAWERLVPGR